MKPYLYLTLLLFTTCGSLYAAPQKEDLIDIALEKAIEKNPNTLGMIQALNEANEKWLKEIDRALTKLETEMSPEQWKALQASQKAWLAYREKELEFQTAFYRKMQGTVWGPIGAEKRVERNRERALLLRGYTHSLSTSPGP